MLAKSYSKFSKPAFSNMWTVNFQMFKLDLEKAEEPEINCQHPLDHQNSKEFQKNIHFCFIDYAKAFEYVNHNKLWKILKEMGVPDYLTCLLRKLFVDKEATVRNGHGTIGSKLGKECIRAVYCHPAYLTYMQSTSCKMPGWMNHKLKSRLLREISATSDMQMIPL